MELKPLVPNIKLKTSPKLPPKYKIEITSSSGQKIICGDPKVTRALVLLMDLHAVSGGAAAHWGGPAALAEIMSALHSFMFRETQWFEHFCGSDKSDKLLTLGLNRTKSVVLSHSNKLSGRGHDTAAVASCF